MRDISDIRFIDSETIQIEERDMRGKRVMKNLLDFSAKELYTTLLEVYELGDRDARRRIADALAGRTSYS